MGAVCWHAAPGGLRSGGGMNSFLVPGALVRHPTQPDWGVGQVQSVVGERVTVNFEERGKVVINVAAIELEVIEAERPG